MYHILFVVIVSLLSLVTSGVVQENREILKDYHDVKPVNTMDAENTYEACIRAFFKNGDVNELREELIKLTAEMLEMKNFINKLNTQAEELKSEINKANNENIRLITRQNDLSFKCEEYETEIKKLQKKFSSLESKTNNNKIETSELRENENCAKQDSGNIIPGLKEQITDALNTSDWSPVVQLLERSLCSTGLIYEQLQDSRPAKYLPWIAAERGYTELINVLISNGLLIDKKFDGAKYTMLHLASANGHEYLASFLLDNGANIEETDKFGWTAVHHAAVGGRIDLLKLLFKRGADINKKNTTYRYTSLHYAAFFGRLSMVYYLTTSTNCDPSIQSAHGTAADIAKHEGYYSIAEILSKK